MGLIFFFFTFVAVFLLRLFIIFGVGLPAYLSKHNPFSREHIFVGFNEFPSLVYRCTVIHHHRPQGPTPFFLRVRWNITLHYNAICAQTQDLIILITSNLMLSLQEAFHIKHSIWFMYLLVVLAFNMSLVMFMQISHIHFNLLMVRLLSI